MFEMWKKIRENDNKMVRNRNSDFFFFFYKLLNFYLYHTISLLPASSFLCLTHEYSFPPCYSIPYLLTVDGLWDYSMGK